MTVVKHGLWSLELVLKNDPMSMWNPASPSNSVTLVTSLMNIVKNGPWSFELVLKNDSMSMWNQASPSISLSHLGDLTHEYC